MLLKSKLLSFIVAFLFVILITFFPELSKNGVTRGLFVSSNVLIPSLFPFIVCVLLIMKCDINCKNRLINKILYKILGHNFQMFFVFILSMLGGYPIGAKLINELYKENIIDNKSANIMLMYCVNAGPAFIISVVGGFLNSQTLGKFLLLSHIISSIIIALIFSKILRNKNCQYKIKTNNIKTFSQNFVDSIADASGSIITLCSFVIVFSVINSYFDCFFGNTAILKYATLFTEVTSGIIKTKNIFLISFLLGISGISIWCQIFALTKDIKLNYSFFLSGRLLHAILSTILTKIFITVFKVNITTFSNYTTPIKQGVYSDKTLFISMVIMLSLLLVFFYSKNNSRNILIDVV